MIFFINKKALNYSFVAPNQFAGSGNLNVDKVRIIHAQGVNLPRGLFSHSYEFYQNSQTRTMGGQLNIIALAISVFYMFLIVLIVDSKYIGGYFAFTRSDTVSIIFFDGANKGSIKPRVASKEQL